MTDANADFALWATSFAGCDGGRLAGHIWLCGLEYGGEVSAEALRDWIRTPELVPPAAYAATDRERSLKYTYNLKAIKLFRAIKGRGSESPAEFLASERCFERDGGYFKLNLFPISFKNTAPSRWPASGFAAVTGLPNRFAYEQWCQQQRFPRLRAWMVQGKPRLIIGTGITHAADFLKAFGEAGSNPVVHHYSAGGRRLRISHFLTNAGATLVAVIPFLGNRNGLNSNASIEATGRELAELLRMSSILL
jgi:hypothetical protein